MFRNKKRPVAKTGTIGERMKSANKYDVIQAYKLDGDVGPIELLRISFKSGGANCYLPHDVIQFLNLNENTKSLVAFLDSTGATNFLIIANDEKLVEMLRPIILERRRRAEEMKQQLKSQLQPQEEVKQGDFVVDVGVEK